jgi:signal transduction histidine kinase
LKAISENTIPCEDCLNYMLWQWAHDLPINAKMILEDTEKIRSVIGKIPGDLQRLNINLDRIQRLAEEIINLDSPFQMEPVFIDDLLYKRTQERHEEIAERGICLEIQVDSPGTKILANYIWLRRLLDTFIDNSLEALKQSSPVVYSGIPLPVILIHSIAQGDRLKMTFRDTGPGFDPLVFDNLFERPRDLQPYGRGRGLYIARLLVEIYGGSIEPDLEYHTGAGVIIYLPIISE